MESIVPGTPQKAGGNTYCDRLVLATVVERNGAQSDQQPLQVSVSQGVLVSRLPPSNTSPLVERPGLHALRRRSDCSTTGGHRERAEGTGGEGASPGRAGRVRY